MLIYSILSTTRIQVSRIKALDEMEPIQGGIPRQEERGPREMDKREASAKRGRCLRHASNYQRVSSITERREKRANTVAESGRGLTKPPDVSRAL